jgi:hypothetical protein
MNAPWEMLTRANIIRRKAAVAEDIIGGDQGNGVSLTSCKMN